VRRRRNAGVGFFAALRGRIRFIRKAVVAHGAYHDGLGLRKVVTTNSTMITADV
jgi:hypothetical protein